PVPPPDPPGPTPIPAQGLRVLMVYETSELNKMPPQQLLVLHSQTITDYMNSHCAKVGTQPEWRKFDKDTDVSKQSTIWQDAMKRPRQSIPWLVVSNGKDGY